MGEGVERNQGFREEKNPALLYYTLIGVLILILNVLNYLPMSKMNVFRDASN